MVNAEDMSSEEAQAYLSKLQKKTRQRQRDYVARKEGDGHRRINTFISAEANEILEREQSQSGNSIGDVLSDALLYYAKRQRCVSQSQVVSGDKAVTKQIVSGDKAATKQIVSGDKAVTKQRPQPHKVSGDKSTAEKRIMELADGGYGLADICRQLEEEGIRTPQGLPNWQKTTVRRIIKRLRG